ncbi:MAG: putative Na+/H+ antiporter, partial [Oligoflexia bacterium]|nr:putative Na+/H+ antiporter [Oligoflexia bacterium]
MMKSTAALSELIATGCFVMAIFHTFLVKRFHHLARRYRSGSVGENLFHLLGEIEVVFGLWGGAYLLGRGMLEGTGSTIRYLESLNFTEPAFVFVIMAVCSTQPILGFAEAVIDHISRLLPWRRPIAFYLTTLVVGP